MIKNYMIEHEQLCYFVAYYIKQRLSQNDPRNAPTLDNLCFDIQQNHKDLAALYGKKVHGSLKMKHVISFIVKRGGCGAYTMTNRGACRIDQASESFNLKAEKFHATLVDKRSRLNEAWKKHQIRIAEKSDKKVIRLPARKAA